MASSSCLLIGSLLKQFLKSEYYCHLSTKNYQSRESYGMSGKEERAGQEGGGSWQICRYTCSSLVPLPVGRGWHWPSSIAPRDGVPLPPFACPLSLPHSWVSPYSSWEVGEWKTSYKFINFWQWHSSWQFNMLSEFPWFLKAHLSWLLMGWMQVHVASGSLLMDYTIIFLLKSFLKASRKFE